MIAMVLSGVGASLLQSPAAITQSLPTVIISNDNVELTGAGELNVDLTASDKAMIPISDPDSMPRFKLWFDASGKPIECTSDYKLASSIVNIGCGLLMKHAVFKLNPGLTLPYTKGFVQVDFGMMRTVRSGSKTVLVSLARPVYENGIMVYPPIELPDNMMLHNTDGGVVMPGPLDYPPLALISEVEGRSSILLGIDRAGEIKTCRPVTGVPEKGAAYLDNYTCSLFLRIARFQFASTAPKFDGVRYRRASIRWVIPSTADRSPIGPPTPPERK